VITFCCPIRWPPLMILIVSSLMSETSTGEGEPRAPVLRYLGLRRVALLGRSQGFLLDVHGLAGVLASTKATTSS